MDTNRYIISACYSCFRFKLCRPCVMRRYMFKYFIRWCGSIRQKNAGRWAEGGRQEQWNPSRCLWDRRRRHALRTPWRLCRCWRCCSTLAACCIDPHGYPASWARSHLHTHGNGPGHRITDARRVGWALAHAKFRHLKQRDRRSSRSRGVLWTRSFHPRILQRRVPSTSCRCKWARPIQVLPRSLPPALFRQAQRPLQHPRPVAHFRSR
mmetsp:Transcript_14711/g.41651  ORF Transcript_14711/g.41651 Transcript_14711/m.41651 type:complete len:209 (+) Transcript_14711:10-636(+)